MSRIRVIALVAAAALAVSMVHPRPAEARNAGRVIAGIALGAVAAGLLQGYARRAYGYPYGYAYPYPYGYYYAPPPYAYYAPPPGYYYYQAPPRYKRVYRPRDRDWRVYRRRDRDWRRW